MVNLELCCGLAQEMLSDHLTHDAVYFRMMHLLNRVRFQELQPTGRYATRTNPSRAG